MRNPFDSIPIEKAQDKAYKYQMRYERVAKYNDLFKSLRDAQIRVRAVLGDEEVDKAVLSLFHARNKVEIAIELLAEYARDQDSGDKDHLRELRGDLYGSFSDRDELGKKILEAIKCIEDRLSSIARLEK